MIRDTAQAAMTAIQHQKAAVTVTGRTGSVTGAPA
jgi:hypothetical protein